MVVETQGPADSVGELEQVAWRADWLHPRASGKWGYGPDKGNLLRHGVFINPTSDGRWQVLGPTRGDGGRFRVEFAHSWITALVLAHDMILHPKPREKSDGR